MNHLLLITLSSSAHRYETTVNYVDCDVLITDDKVVNVKYNTTNCIFCAVFLVDFSFLDVFFSLKYFCRISSIIFYTPGDLAYAVFQTPEIHFKKRK